MKKRISNRKKKKKINIKKEDTQNWLKLKNYKQNKFELKNKQKEEICNIKNQTIKKHLPKKNLLAVF
jgi:hypothetical protein